MARDFWDRWGDVAREGGSTGELSDEQAALLDLYDALRKVQRQVEPGAEVFQRLGEHDAAIAELCRRVAVYREAAPVSQTLAAQGFATSIDEIARICGALGIPEMPVFAAPMRVPGRYAALWEILLERQRQVAHEGHHESKDDALTSMQLTALACRYLDRADKPYRRRLVIAAALLLAEIERVDRAAK